MAAAAAYSKYEHHVVSFVAEAPYVAHVEINRPAKLNAYYEAMWLEFGRIFAQLSTDPDVRAVVLSGRGDRAFTSGLDLVAAGDSQITKAGEVGGDPARAAAGMRRHITEFQDSISALEWCEKPVIVVMHGLCLGLAIDISSCADVRICTRDVRMAVKEVDIGLAADIGTLSRLPKIVGSQSWVKDVCLTAREFGAEEALAVGFVSAALPTKADALRAAIELAGRMASKSPVAVQGTKEILNHARDHTVADSLRYTVVWNAAALQTKDVGTAIKASMQKKKPTFEKL